VKTEYSEAELDIPAFMRRGLAVQNAADQAAAQAIKAEVEEKAKLKARGRIAKMKAKQAGELRAMPLSGKAALAKINGF